MKHPAQAGMSTSADTYFWAPPALGGTTTCLDNEDITERAEGKPTRTIPSSTGWAHQALPP